MDSDLLNSCIYVNRNSFGNIKDEMKLICEWLRINKLSLNDF